MNFVSIVLVISFIFGWVANIAAILQPTFDIASFLGFARIVGIVFYPLGIVLGWVA